MAATSIRDVAARAGVSVGTVSNVLNHPDKVSADSVARVSRGDRRARVRAQRRGPAAAGRPVSTTIGLVVLDVRNPFFTDVARGAEDEAAQHGDRRSSSATATRSSTREAGLPRPVRGAAGARGADLAVRRRRPASAPAAFARASPPCSSTASATTARSARSRSTTSRAGTSPSSISSTPGVADRLRRRAVRDPPGDRPTRGGPRGPWRGIREPPSRVDRDRTR